MDENKVTGIRQIVKLKEMLQKWQQATIGAKEERAAAAAACSGISPEISWRLKKSNNVQVQCESDEESCQSLEMLSDVPRGFLAVYVGPEHRRFIIPTTYLSHPLFKVLLEKVEEEFGFDHTGGLTIPCDTETFKYLLKCMENHNKQGETSLPEEEIRAD
ncbi:hypothetical protein ACS0TY_021603 [Phlomoides rotata]